MSRPIDMLLSGELAPGVYQLDMSQRPTAICRQVNVHGWRCFYLDGRTMVNKQSVLEETARVMSFPDYYGHNWDALEECITDLSWIEESGCVLLYDHAAVLVAQHPDVWATLFDIVTSAADYWNSRSRPFYLVLRNAGRIQQSVPAL